MDRRIDIAVAAAFALFGLFMILHATTIRMGLYKDPVGPRAFFYGCGAIMLAGGVFTVVQRLRRWKSHPSHMIASEGSVDDEAYPASAWRAFGVVATTAVYALVMEPLGFLLASPLFVYVALSVLGQTGVLKKIAIAVIYTLSAYIVFAQILNVRISVGPFTSFFRDMGWIYL